MKLHLHKDKNDFSHKCISISFRSSFLSPMTINGHPYNVKCFGVIVCRSSLNQRTWQRKAWEGRQKRGCILMGVSSFLCQILLQGKGNLSMVFRAFSSVCKACIFALTKPMRLIGGDCSFADGGRFCFLYQHKAWPRRGCAFFILQSSLGQYWFTT